MSNYKIEGYSSKHNVMVGWDPMLNTFFAHVIDTEKSEEEDGRDVLWIGCSPHEVLNIEEVLRSVEQYAPIDQETYNQLYSDAHA